jgi:hypothetical protein
VDSEVYINSGCREISFFFSKHAAPLYKDQLVNAVGCENRAKSINTLCGQNMDLYYVKTRDTFSYHSALKD